MIRTVVILGWLALSGCGAEDSPAQAAELGVEFTLAPAATASVKAAGVKVRFVSVVEDSRCPRDLTCVWAGEVKVLFEVQQSAQAASRVEMVEGGSTVVGAYRLTLVQVGPQAAGNAQIAPQDYRATLVIVKS